LGEDDGAGEPSALNGLTRADGSLEQITCQPGYRSTAGTGYGCAVGRWIP